MTGGDTGVRRGWRFLIVAAIASTVFNDFPAMVPAGEMSRDPFVVIFPLLLLGLAIRPAAIRMPPLLTLLTFALLAAVLSSVVSNYEDIATASFKGRSGLGRIISQGMILAFGLIVALAAYNLVLRGRADAIFLGARVGLLLMAGIGALEFASWFSVPGPTQLYEALSRLIHFDTYEFYPRRLRSTAFEVSWTAVMLTFVFPFAVMSVTGRQRAILLGIVVVMIALAQSRTAMLTIGLQLLVLCVILSAARIDRFVHVGAGLAMAAFGLMLIPGAADQVTDSLSNLVEYGSLDGPYERAAEGENISNVTRLAHVRVGLEMFRDNPLSGVGFGQYGFNYPAYIRAEDMRSWEVRAYILSDPQNQDWPPIYSNHVRFLAELGAAGYAIWLLMLGLPIWRGLRYSDPATEAGRFHLAAAIVLFGWILLGASIDSLRFFGGWIALGVAYAIWDARAATSRAPVAETAETVTLSGTARTS